MNNVITNQPVISITNLFFAYAQQPVVDNLSLQINAGEIICVLGASGCGKSTLLNLIAGLLYPTSGTIVLNSSSSIKGRGRQIGYIFQNDALFPWHTIESNLKLVCEFTKELDSIQERIDKYLQIFHLSPSVLKKYPSQLSGGMRQRISIIQTLMFNPNILLLDEPFAALDFFTKLRLESELYQLIKEQNKAALVVTHDIDEAIAIADRILIMDKGNVSKEFKIDFGPAIRSPEDIRGTTSFAEYYHSVWSELRTAIINN